MKRASLVFALFSLVATSEADAVEPSLHAESTCAKIAAPGRILCEVKASTRSGRLVWADALVERAPPFARPLRSRVVLEIAPSDGSRGGHAAAKLALVGAEAGVGQLQIEVRAVICRDTSAGEACAPERVPVSAAVEVAPPSP